MVILYLLIQSIASCKLAALVVMLLYSESSQLCFSRLPVVYILTQKCAAMMINSLKLTWAHTGTIGLKEVKIPGVYGCFRG